MASDEKGTVAGWLSRLWESVSRGGRWVYLKTPESFKPHFRIQFIWAHYSYLIGLSIIGSIIVFPDSIMAYIDALFFAAGSATQSGLNTIDTNALDIRQQVTFMLIACIANPIFINTAVVYVRLYWFEKRFQTIVKDIRSRSRSRARTISRSRSDMRNDMAGEQELGRRHMGVGKRSINVLHHTTRPNGMSGTTAATHEEEREFVEKMGLNLPAKEVESTPESSNKSSEHSDDIASMNRQSDLPREDALDVAPATYMGLSPALQNRGITFADEVPTEHQMQTPHQERTQAEAESRENKHIQILTRQQRNARTDEGTLRIPGPRGFDQGEKPQELDDSDDEDLHRPQTRNTLGPSFSEQSRDANDAASTGDDHGPSPRRGITFNEIPGRQAREDASVGDNTEANTGSSNLLDKLKGGIHHRRNASRGPVMSERQRSMAKTFSSMTTARSREKLEMPYLSWQATTGRNSAFLGLTEEQREELGGIEYRALKTLSWILLCYFIGFHTIAMIIFLPYILYSPFYADYIRSVGVNPAWWGVFTPASMFNDLGFTLSPDSMISFQTSVVPLFFGSFFIVIGNTGFPCMLRFVIWIASKLVPKNSTTWEELHFLLDHPRRCFTLLFPAKATWVLFGILCLLNGLDLILFIILDLNDPTVTHLTPGYRVLNGWFQATSTRTAGFACVNLADLHPAIQVSYLIMMYISVFPIAISVRRTNVYEEKSLGLWGGEEDVPPDGEGEGKDPSYVGQHLRRQLSFDLWFIFLGFFIICIVEGPRLANTNEPAFTLFSVLFEIVSAYGTVGLSLGYPGINASFSAEFKVISKLVIIAMMLRGRHRGLPYALDRAILLPSENLHRKEQEDADKRHNRRGSGMEDEDQLGLPRQHTIDVVGEGPFDQDGIRRTWTRRGSTMTTDSGKERKRQRSKSFGGLLASGFGAGPTFERFDKYS